MAHKNNNGNAVDLRETYRPRVSNGNYQPVIPTAVAGQQPKPPIGDSGVALGEKQRRASASTVCKRHFVRLNAESRCGPSPA